MNNTHALIRSGGMLQTNRRRPAAARSLGLVRFGLVMSVVWGCSGQVVRDPNRPAPLAKDGTSARTGPDKKIVRKTTPAKPAKAAKPELVGGWYGWQVLLADAEWIGLYVLASQKSNPVLEATLLGSAIAGYTLGGPAVHAIHDEWEMAGVSLFLRVGLPLAGGYIGSKQGSDCSESRGFQLCFDLGPAIGFVTGMAAAMTIDAVALAHEPVREKRYRPTLAPLFGLRQDGGFLGISGRF